PRSGGLLVGRLVTPTKLPRKLRGRLWIGPTADVGRRFQIASERLIWPRSMRSSASFAMAGPIGARDAALSMRFGSRQLRTDRWPSTGQSQSDRNQVIRAVIGPSSR